MKTMQRPAKAIVNWFIFLTIPIWGPLVIIPILFYSALIDSNFKKWAVGEEFMFE